MIELDAAGEHLAEAIVETVREPLLVLDGELRVRLANRAFYRTFQVAAEETVGIFLFDLGERQWEIPALRRLLDDILPENTSFDDFEVKQVFPVIGPRIMLLNGRRVEHGEGSMPLILLAIEDVTARREAEAQMSLLNQRLERSNRELQDFASVASHDLQEPLRKINAFGDRLVARCGEQLNPEGRDYLQRMQGAARRMQHLIEDLLVFSRVETKARPFVPVDLGIIAREVLSDLEVRVAQSGAEITVGPLPVVAADPSQMGQLLQNLLGNALKFHRPGEAPRITVSGETTADGRAEIRVADDGIGFDEKYLDRIFTVFQRLHGRGEYEGTGVGLAVCRKIAERHGGSVTARSAPGQGATFIVTLPVSHAGEESIYESEL